MSKPVFVIIGASTAGTYAAATLRKEGFDGAIVLIGAEKELPYARPPLSKEYLRAERGRERLLLWPPTFYSEQRIELQLGQKVIRVRPRERELKLEDKHTIKFDKLLIATGMQPRRLPVPGADMENVFYLRTLDDCDRIANAHKPGDRAVIVGAGFIGMEVAASLREQEVEVSVVHKGKVALAHAIGEEAGRILTEYHVKQGVDFRPESEIESIEGRKRAERVVLKSGEKIDCQSVTIGIGVVPHTDFLADSGIEVANGIPVDECCRTNMDGILAAGDVTRFLHPAVQTHLHVEHWEHARLHGMTAAQNMLGKSVPYRSIPFFWSDQYDLNIQYVGFPFSYDTAVLRGDPGELFFSAFLLSQNRLVAAVSFNRWRDTRASEHLIINRTPLVPEKLRDEDIPLESLS
ncbi:MAG: FAD-dependent oxidoreductase [Candidatus Abyssubacteria bacterium]